jgi:transcriptional regulator with PAS, ATPase and Fis domain
VKDQKGKFEIADGGTLFLDEIGELPLSTQAKLLLVIENGMMDRIGSETPKHVDVRIVAATNRRLGEEIVAKRFREDLFYRLNTAEVRLPPLRERRSDVPRIAARMLDGINRNSRLQRQFSPDALGRLQNYDWPGNVRDLHTVVRRAVMFSGGKAILGAEDIQFDDTLRLDSFAHLPEPHEGFDLKRYQAEVRSRLIKKALQMTGNNQTQAARLLTISPQAVSNYLNEQDEESATN